MTEAKISYTPIEAAQATGRSRARIFRAIQHGELMARKDGRATIIESLELQRWVQSFPIVDRQPLPAQEALAVAVSTR